MLSNNEHLTYHLGYQWSKQEFYNVWSSFNDSEVSFREVEVVQVSWLPPVSEKFPLAKALWEFWWSPIGIAGQCLVECFFFFLWI